MKTTSKVVETEHQRLRKNDIINCRHNQDGVVFDALTEIQVFALVLSAYNLEFL